MEYIKKVNEVKNEDEFKLSQYEGHANSRFFYKEIVKARYIKQEEPEYIGNPLIEALPPSYSLGEIKDVLENRIPFSVDERLKDSIYRIQAISRLKDLLFVMGKHINIAYRVEMAIKRGYSTKTLPTPSVLREKHLEAEQFGERFIEQTGQINGCLVNQAKTPMSGFTIFGVSGGGKSVAINNILSMYPQAIEHNEYKDDKILFKQLVWVKIDCTYNGSIKGICEKFFEEVDSILGTTYHKKNKTLRVDLMITSMAKVVNLHGLGCLVIDEIQHVANSKSGAEAVMNFLVTLENEIKVPIILVGTYKAVKKVLTQDFRQARRASGIGEVEWGRMENDQELENFMKKLWHYQWVKTPGELTDGIIKQFYESTMGITDRIIKLFMLCQVEAIMYKIEIINEEMVKEVARSMPLTDGIIKAIRDNNLSELSKYDDICPFDVESIIEGSLNNLATEQEFKRIQNSIESQAKENERTMRGELIFFAMEMGVTQKKAEKVTDKLLKGNVSDTKLSTLKRKLVEMILTNKEEPTPKVEKVLVPDVGDFNRASVNEFTN